MKTRWYGLALLALASCVLTVSGGDTMWKEHTWDKGKCKVLLPGVPKDLVSKAGGVETTMIMVDGGKHVHLIAFTPNAQLATASKELKDQAYDGGRDAAAKSIKGTLTKELKVKLGDVEGREIHIDSPAIGIYRARLFIVGDRMYQVVVAGPKEMALSKESDKFLDSFKVIEDGKGPRDR